jgi:hypothetical protein
MGSYGEPGDGRGGRLEQPLRAKGRRVEKSVNVEDREVTFADGSVPTVPLYRRGGAIGIGALRARR